MPVLLVLLLLVVAAPVTRADDDLTVANLNVLHGFGCVPDQCRLADRVDLLFDWIEGSGCPDLVTLQEVNDNNISARALIEAAAPLACGGQYTFTAFSGVLGADEEMFLSRYPLSGLEVRQLHSALGPGFTRHVFYARVAHPAGTIDAFTTHLSSGSDGATDPCGVNCPVECVSASATTYRECQAVQLALFVDSRHDVDAPAIITGDLNAEPGSFEYNQLANRGYLDSFLEAGNAECTPGTAPLGCTSGRASDLIELESTVDNVDRRIDYTFVVPPPTQSSCTIAFDPASDDDADGSATRIFADVSNPFVLCGPLSPICWPSDHEGSELDLGLSGCSTESMPALPLYALVCFALLVLGSTVACQLRRHSH